MAFKKIRRPFLGFAFALFLALPGLFKHGEQPIRGLTAHAGGSLRQNGVLPTEPNNLRAGAPARYWSSWNKYLAQPGWLTLGPFPAPRILGVPAGGYPHIPGLSLDIQNRITGERLSLSEGNLGSTWSDLRIALPSAWRGQPVVLSAVCTNEGLYHWLVVGAPVSVAPWAALWTPFTRKLHAFISVGIILVLYLGVARRAQLRFFPGIAGGLEPLFALGLVGLVGFGLFWVFLANATAGMMLAWGLLAAAWAVGPARATKSSRLTFLLPVSLFGAIAFGSFGSILLYGSERALSDVAARRYTEEAAIDNLYPQLFAEHLFRNETPHYLTYSWKSSDRPPLQTCYVLAVAGPVVSAGSGLDEAAQSAGIWVQFSWVLAAWAWFRALGVSYRKSALLILALVPASVLVFYSAYAWPKLLGGAFAMGAYTSWFAHRSRSEAENVDPVARIGTGGFLAALGFLSHGGVAFSFIGLVPFVFGSLRREGWRPWLLAAGIFLGMVVPWMGYQHWVDPPGNRMLKFHLAGVHDEDPRSFLRTWVDAYRAVSLDDVIKARIEDLRVIVGGPWTKRLSWHPEDRAAILAGEFSQTFFALGVWNFGFLMLAWLYWKERTATQWRSRGPPPDGCGESEAWMQALLWCGLTLGAGVLLLFEPGATLIHQGSIACPLMLLCVLAYGLGKGPPLLLVLVAAANAAQSALFLLPAPISRPAPVHMEGIAVIVTSIVGVAFLASLFRPGVIEQGP